MRREIVLMCALSAVGFGQDFPKGTTFTATGSGTVTTANWDGPPNPHLKKCAFGLESQWLLGGAKPSPKLPDPRDQFNDASKANDYFTAAPAIYRMPPHHESCPYERAIELFGEDRVKFEEKWVCAHVHDCGPDCAGVCDGDPRKPNGQNGYIKDKLIMVDDQVVYEEK